VSQQINVDPNDQGQVPLYENGLDIGNVYTTRPGVCVLPLAEDPPTTEAELATYCPVVTLQLHAPYRERRTMQKANKCSAPPVLQAPSDAGRFKFLGGDTIIHNTLRQDQLGFDWQGATVYTFVELAPPIPSDGLVLGTPPWVWPAVVAAIQASPGQATQPPTGSVATAGAEVILAAGVGNQIDPSNGGYAYQFPSYYPGTFFNYFMVNGGPPTYSESGQ